MGKQDVMPYCHSCEFELLEEVTHCPKCGSPVELKGSLWDIYSRMVTRGVPLNPDELSPSYGSHEAQFYLGRMEKMGFILRNQDGKFKPTENRQLDIVLPYLLGKQNATTSRYVFYSTFSIISLVISLIYIAFLPYNPMTNIFLYIAFLLISLVSFLLEMISIFRLKAFTEKLLIMRRQVVGPN
jgi:hypothetical protein